MVVTTVYPRITRPPDQTMFLFGVRDVGTSTWAGTRFEPAHRVDLLDESSPGRRASPAASRWTSSCASELLERLAGNALWP
jgi:hypothetical protein